MFTITRNRSTHGQRLERWLGSAQVEHISKSMKDWYGPPVALAGVPGNVWAHRGGDFGGILKSGQFLNAVDFGVMKLQRRLQAMGRANRAQLNVGFASLSDLISEATNGKRREIFFQKAGATGVVAVTNSLWRLGNQPVAGGAGSAAPGGRVLDNTTVGAQFGLDAVSTDTRHFVQSNILASVAGNTLLMYDRIFDVAKTMNSTATEAVTGVPTRYQSTTATAQDYIGGNFLFVEVGGTALAATAHNWTVCTYLDQANAASTLPSLTGNASAIVDRLDHPTSSWFAPLEAGDVGIKALTQMQCSAAVATGVVNFVIGHPLAWMPCPVANMACLVDGINTAFNLVRVYDAAAIAFLEVSKPSTTATTYTGNVTFIHG